MLSADSSPKTLKDIHDLHHKNHQLVPHDSIILWLYSITSELCHLHNENIVNANVNPSNIVIDQAHARLGGSTTGRYITSDDAMYLLVDRPENKIYAAPEAIQKKEGLSKKDLCKTDLWSLGAVFAELCLVGHDSPALAQLHKEKTKDLQRMVEIIQSLHGDALAKLLTSLLKYDSHERKSAQQVKKYLEDNFDLILV